MFHERESIIGKTITGVITRNAGRGRNPSLVMLRFSDGSYYEFVSPAALNSLKRFTADQLSEDQQACANDAPSAEPQLAISGV